MRRTLLAAALALLVTTPAHATPAAVTDPAGDWQVPSQDVRRVLLDSGRKAARVTFELAGEPDRAAVYRAYLVAADCAATWILRAEEVGTAGQRAVVEHGACAGATAPTTPATVTVRGTRLEITAPYARRLKKGVRITRVNALVAAVFTGTYVGYGLGQDGFVLTGDMASGWVDHRLR